jgi:DNA repair protein RecN (Recombination protein N)
MLVSLHIANFAIVDQLELDLSMGMTAFTGETGAGKSIMIDALALALGAKADSSVVRKEAKQCEINAVFNIDEDSHPAQWCNQHDLSFDDDMQIILRRVINSAGRSKCYINGQPFPLHKIKELSSMLVDIHGQHQHQTLLNHQTHRKQLDDFAKHDALVKEVYHYYQEWQQLNTRLKELNSQSINQDRKDLLTYQVQELEELELKTGELENLDTEHHQLHHAKSYIETAQTLIELLQSDDSQGITHLINDAINLCQSLPQENSAIKQCSEMLNNALIQCEEAATEVSHYAQNLTLDPERLYAIEKRLESIHDIARKHHVDAKLISNHLSTLQQELNQIQNLEDEKNQLQNEIKKAQQNYQTAAHKLSESREKFAKKLAQKITQTIRQLGMPKGIVEIELSSLEKMHAHGMDRIEYKVCTNPGMNMDSLAKIASGGELSRISLAIQVITAQKASTPTLLFDEVDVGIGGATAAMVGQLLKTLAKRLQVFCVTHQAQVASSAHHHFLVSKHDKAGKTYSNIELLDEAKKIEEIARMLGGLTITDHSLIHAKELLAQT